jgi:hypothetical protein
MTVEHGLLVGFIIGISCGLAVRELVLPVYVWMTHRRGG